MYGIFCFATSSLFFALTPACPWLAIPAVVNLVCGVIDAGLGVRKELKKVNRLMGK